MNLVRTMTVLACVALLALGVVAGAADDAGPELPSAAAATNALVAGRAALEDGLYDLAEKELRVCLTAGGEGSPSSTESAEAAVLLLQTLYAQGRFAAMFQALDSYGALASQFDSLAPSYWRALALYEGGEFAKALAALSGGVREGQDSRYARQAQQLQAWCLLKAGRVEDAIAASRKNETGRNFMPAECGEQIEWAKALNAAGKTEEAQGIFERLVTVPHAERVAGESFYWLGQIRLRQERVDDAVGLLTVVTTNPAVREDLRASAWYGLAAAYQTASNLAPAAAALTNGIAQAQDSVVRRKGEQALGLLLLDMNRYDEAISVLRQFVASQPDDPEAGPTQLRLASSLLDHGAWEDAVREYQRYMESFTNRTGIAQAQEGRGWALAGLGRHAEAALGFLKAYDLETNQAARARCLMKACDSYLSNGQYKLAIDAYARVPAEFPGSELVPRARFQMAESCLQAGDPARAEEVFMALAKDQAQTPLAEESLLRVAEIRQADRRMEDAVVLYDQIDNVYSNGLWRDKALLGRGLAYYQMYRFQAALGDFQAVAAAFPTNRTAEDAAYWSAMCLYWMGRDDESVAAGREFLKWHPDSKWIPTVMFWLGKHEFNRQAYADAEALFVSFSDKMPADPKVPDALLWASRAAATRGEYLRANEIVSRLVKEHPEAWQVAEARAVQGDALINLARFSEAILVFEDLITRYPASGLLPLAWLRKGDAQFMLGGENPERYVEALQSFRIVAGDSQAPLDQVLQAEYKTGRCYEKMGRADDAVEQYYAKVVVWFLQEREKGILHTEAAKLWFMRASFNAADIMEARKEWRQVVTILERVVNAGVPVTPETRERISRIRAERWWLFY
jgi:TolA-binding protein